jgi:hypothetical protein
MFKIDQKVPLPQKKAGGGGAKRKYPWCEMNVNDSFFVPEGNFTSLRCSASAAGKTYKRKFIARQIANGVRIWRVK